MTQIKKIPKIFNFIDPKFFELAEISGVGLVMANNDGLKQCNALSIFNQLKSIILQVYIREARIRFHWVPVYHRVFFQNIKISSGFARRDNWVNDLKITYERFNEWNIDLLQSLVLVTQDVWIPLVSGSSSNTDYIQW